MSTKRFVYVDAYEYTGVGLDGAEEPLTCKECADLLNNLTNENEELKYKYNEKCNEYIGLEEQVDGLLNENEKLKDEYHTMQELYDFRLMYNALLFNEWANHDDIEVYKSKRHYDGNIPFDDEDWFIVVAILPTGKQITNHYHIDYWDYFHIKEYPKVKHEFDNHTSVDVLNRLKECLE